MVEKHEAKDFLGEAQDAENLGEGLVMGAALIKTGSSRHRCC